MHQNKIGECENENMNTHTPMVPDTEDTQRHTNMQINIKKEEECRGPLIRPPSAVPSILVITAK